MNILVYFPYNQRSVEQQSVMEMFVKEGHSVFLLTLTPTGNLHAIVGAIGVSAYASPYQGSSKLNIFKNAFFLYKFCAAHKIDIIFAHQQLCALPLIFARPLIKARVFYVRHNSDEDYLHYASKARLMNRFINRMLPKIIAPSKKVYDFLITTEKVDPAKLIRINYGYNFTQYEKANEAISNQIKKEYACDLLIVSIARLTSPKRHLSMFTAIKQSADKGLDIKLVCLGDGPLKEELTSWVEKNNMPTRIFLLGIKKNIFDYLYAADLLMHLSETEASNSVVKEAAISFKPVIVCNDVGDFSDYVHHEQNGFLVNKEEPVTQTAEIIQHYIYKKDKLRQLGNNLEETVVKLFNINNIEPLYTKLISNN